MSDIGEIHHSFSILLGRTPPSTSDSRRPFAVWIDGVDPLEYDVAGLTALRDLLTRALDCYRAAIV